MNILILSVATGGGHIKTSNSIKEYICNNNSEANVRIVDTLSYINPILNKTISNGYKYLAMKTPRIYGELYELANKENSLNTLVSKLNNIFSNKLIPLISEFEPNIIITTHPFSTEMVSILKEKRIVDIPLLCIMTDYSSHKTWINTGVDAYIVSNKDMVVEMIEQGVDRNKVYSYGIPVDELFLKKENKEELLDELGLEYDKKIILIMAGSFGVTKILEIYKNLTPLNKDFQIVLVTGKNQKLYNKFKKEITHHERPIKLIYFTEEINKFMKVADIIITKPGGLTITEAIASKIPMILFDAIPGQEEENAEFLVKYGIALKCDNNKSCNDCVVELLDNEKTLEKMKEACKELRVNQSNEKIYRLINFLVDEKENEKNCVI